MINIPSILVWLGPTLLFNEIGLFSFYFSMFVKTAFISTLLSVGCKGWSPLYKAWIKGLCLHAMSLQSCLTLCDPMDCSPPGTSVHGIFQARILEWIAMPSSRGSSQPRDRTHVSYVSCTDGWVQEESAGNR